MSDYAWVSIRSPQDFAELENHLDSEFAPKVVIEGLRSAISPRVAGVLVELGYIDKDYRSTFYRHYAKKGRAYRDDCVRLHFFDAGVSFDAEQTTLSSMTPTLEGQYFGFMVLRPTIHSTIGRSVLSPDIRIGARGRAIQGQHVVHLLGHKISVWGFPSMSQHADISVCAHVCCWSILRHYSERYPEHREWLLQDITRMASQFDPGGLTPSLGLSVVKAERILQEAGTYPLLVVRNENGADPTFYAQFLAYLESGFPLFIGMAEKNHAVVVVGHNWADPPNKEIKEWFNSHAWEQVETILTVDDNALPYVSVNRDPVSGPIPPKGPDDYDANDFSAFVVALPEKIFYSAEVIEKYSKETLYDFLEVVMRMPARPKLLRRYFITTVSGLRKFARNDSALGTQLANMIMRLKTAQFVWVVEYASLDQWSKGQITARAIVDATASPNDEVPVWFAHGEQQGYLFDRDMAGVHYQTIDLKRAANAPLGRMEPNLRPIREWKRGAPSTRTATV